jgi:hypothetical protein
MKGKDIIKEASEVFKIISHDERGELAFFGSLRNF